MRTSAEKNRVGYNPTEIEVTFMERISELRQKLESTTDTKKRAEIQENIGLMQEEMGGLRSEI